MADVLVIEDRPQIRKFVALNLTARGYNVEEASNGVEGLTKLQRECPDVLLLDIKMPGMSGIDVLDAMGADSNLEQIPVILMTASSESIDRHHDVYQNIVEVLTKPLSVFRLVEVVRRAIHERQGGNDGHLNS